MRVPLYINLFLLFYIPRSFYIVLEKGWVTIFHILVSGLCCMFNLLLHSPTVPSTIYLTISSQWIKPDLYYLPVKYNMMCKFSPCAFANHKPLFSFIHINSHTSQKWNPVILCCLGIPWKLGVLYVLQLKLSFSCQVFCLVFILVTMFYKILSVYFILDLIIF